jgi:hypothetical protein
VGGHTCSSGDMIDRDDGQNFHVERTMKGLACVKSAEMPTRSLIGSQRIFSTAIQVSRATQLMRQGVGSDGNGASFLLANNG